jgi:hypothetical protein
MHIITSDFNIISNSLTVVSDFNTVVDVPYYKNWADIANPGIEYMEMKIDDNLKPEAHRRGTCETPGADGERMSYSYGSTYLRKEAEKMYTGKIIVLGNQYMKQGDYAIIDDAIRGINGIIKIRECIQHFDSQNGFVTEITPGLFVESAHKDYSLLFTKLYISTMPVLMQARGMMHSNNSSDIKFLNTSLALDMFGFGNNTDISFSDYFLSQEGLTSIGNVTGLIGGGVYAVNSVYKFFVPTASSVTGGLAKSATSTLTRIAMLSTSTPKQALFTVMRLASPWILFGGLAIHFVSTRIQNTINSIILTRQPVRLYPLKLNGRPYVGGIWGYHEGTYLGDKWLNIQQTIKSAGILLGYMTRNY